MKRSTIATLKLILEVLTWIIVLFVCMFAIARIAKAQPIPPAIILPPAQTNLCVRLEWDRSPDAGVAYYTIHKGGVSGIYTEFFNVGTNLTTLVCGLQPGGVYYFAATCTGTNQLQSDFSNEVAYTAPLDVPPGAPTFTGVMKLPIMTVVIEGADSADGPWKNVAQWTFVVDADKQHGFFRGRLEETNIPAVEWK